MPSNLNRPSRRRVLLTGTAAVGASVAMPWVARGQGALKTEYKLSVVGNRPIPLSEGAFQWAELVTERSKGRINVKVYPGSQLVGGDQTRELVAMRQGVIDFTVSSTINIAPQIKEMAIFTLPWLLQDHKGFDAVINGEVGRDLFKIMETRDVVPLAWGENGFREISNSKRAIRKPEDIKGMKIRFAAGAIFSDIYTQLGANPVQMSFADLQPALSTGAVDGQENPVNLFLAFKMDTLSQKHLSVWNYVADAGVFHVAKPVWDTFTKDDQEIIRGAAQEAAKRQIAAARKGIGINGDNSSIEECKKRGVEVQVLTEAEKKAFGAVVKPTYDKWAAQIGADLVRKAEAAVAKRG